tara:strand:+ start:2204 stop:3442 length:1239 start_codon:yes stop_codon:yes gene_type:complete
MNILCIYNGFSIANNLGDDILYPILIELFKYTLEHKFKILTKDIKKNNIIIDKINVPIIKIIGGGSIIHPLCESFTRFQYNNVESILFIAGTGFTDVNKSNILEENIYKLFDDKCFKQFMFNDNIIKTNYDRISYFKEKNKQYGGFRGIFENELINHSYSSNIPIMNDMGLLSKIIIDKDYNNINLDYNSFNRKIIIINPINIGGIDAFKNKDLSYKDYNKYIDDVLIKFSIYLIKNGYFIYILSCASEKEEYFYNNIVLKLEDNEKKYVTYRQEICSLQDYIFLIKKAYLVIGTRLHCNIIANGLRIPSINIAYGIKNINYAITSQLLDYCVPTFKKYLSCEKLIDIFQNIINKYEDIVSILETTHNKCFNEYIENIEIMLKTLIVNESYKSCNIEINTHQMSSKFLMKFS